jgi:signal transduction histidine kinase
VTEPSRPVHRGDVPVTPVDGPVTYGYRVSAWRVPAAQPPLRGWFLRVPPVLVDVALAIVVIPVVIIAMEVAYEPHATRPPDAGAYLIAVFFGAVLLLRRRWPLIVLLASVTALMIYYIVGYAGVPPALPLAAALYSAAYAGRLRWASLIAGFFVLLELLVRHYWLEQSVLDALAATVEEGSLLMAVVLLGETLRSRRIRLAEAHERLVRVEAAQEREAAQRVAQERLRIAREVHDVLGHTIAAITVQSGLADDVFDERPAEARAAIRTIRGAARDAMRELRAAVSVLRSPDGDDSWKPAPGLTGVPGLAEVARQAGLRAEVTVEGPPRPLPAAVELSAYRIVQESLTNTVKHAAAESVRVTLTYRPDELTVDVVDDGVGGEPASGGHGLLGMTERAAALGGRLEAGPAPGRGFRVLATLPIPEVNP